jgi:hypothetical protein
MRSIGFPELLVICAFLFVILPFWKIFQKAGFPGIMSLTLFVPLLNIIVIFWFAYTEWPVLRELNTFRLRYPAAPPVQRGSQ